ncbi:MAG: DUF3450 family protein [Verrucomicrobiota bacterium]
MDRRIENYRKNIGASFQLSLVLTLIISTGLTQEAEVLTPSSLEKRSELIFEAKESISKESSAWSEQKVLFENLIELREKEIAKIDEFTESARSRVDEVTQKRSELKTEETERKAWRKDFEKRVEGLEASLSEVLPLLPKPVTDKLGNTISRFNEEIPEGQISLQERFRTVLSILSAARDFDSKLTIDSEVREFEGKRYQIDVLYLGLDHAWFVDESGKIAGVGRPTSSGWVWTENRSLASRVRTAIEVNRREIPPSMVSLPFSEKAEPTAESN